MQLWKSDFTQRSFGREYRLLEAEITQGKMLPKIEFSFFNSLSTSDFIIIRKVEMLPVFLPFFLRSLPFFAWFLREGKTLPIFMEILEVSSTMQIGGNAALLFPELF